MHFDSGIKIVCSKIQETLEKNIHNKVKKKKIFFFKDNLKIACNPRENMCPVSKGKEGKKALAA